MENNNLAPMAPVKSEKGNTKLSRSNSAIRWCFTWNNYDVDKLSSFKESLTEKCKGWIFGYEVGSNNTPHLQGYIEFKKKSRPIECFKIKEIHWEKCKGSREDNIKYCSKDGKFEYFLFKPLKIISQLYEWQYDVLEIIKKEPDDRSIYWFWERKGNVGKTCFTKYLMYHYNAIILEGKKNDILYVASLNESYLYIYDIERTLEGRVSYGAIEKIKNGCYMSGKYESSTVLRNNPHIIVFANFPPDLNAVSLDRWIIKKIYGRSFTKVIDRKPS